ncbi:MAG: serine hydrolase domain-containing protein, partial [Mycobacteriales bacterium]
MTDLGFDPARLARLDTHFRRYVDDGRLVGWQLRVGRHGQVAHDATYGLADREAGVAVADDTLWRLYSMTKPVTSVAAMSLWEEGAFDLNDEVSRWIPSFADVQVFDRGSATTPFLVPAVEPVRMWHLLAHCSGLTYGFLQVHPVDAIYRANGYEFGTPKGLDLAAAADGWASLPLRFQPGTAWGYGVSTDVLGRVLEVITGTTLDRVIEERVLAPLGMTDCRWSVGEADAGRTAALYAAFEGQAVRYDQMGHAAHKPPRVLSGGGGLIGTVADYWRFCAMLVGGGQLDGTRVLAPRTLELMTRNHLPGGVDLSVANTGGFAETVFEGVGFGLGFATVMDPTP